MTDAVRNDEVGRAQAAIAAAGCDFALLSSLANVTYVSGYEVPVPVGALAELAYGPPLAFVAVRDAACWLLVPNAGATTANKQARGFAVRTFETFDSFSPTDSRASYVGQVRAGLREAGLQRGATLGVEGRTLPFAVSALLRDEFPDVRLVNVEDTLGQARSVKTEREIGLLRRAAQVGDVAHDALAELVRDAGRSEFAMWAEIAARAYAAVGREVPLTGELVTGSRTTTVAYPNGPHARTTVAGDAALMDLSGRVDGYWFDCTNTHLVGGAEPTAEQRRYATASQDACEAAMAALRPGALASDAAAAAEAVFAKHGLPMAHYAGHQIGVTVNELPRLVPYDRTPIEAGMVFSVEPGAYQGPGGSFGARSEKMVLVTPAGPEILSNFAWGT